MNKAWLIAIVPGVLAVVVGVFIFTLFLLKVLWSWTIPDLFPAAVQQNLVAAQISWYTSLKLAIFVAVLAGMGRASLCNRS